MPSEPTMHIRISMVIATIVSALILCWPAYLNGFPLVFGDTGNYIGQAILHYIGWNAPPFYSMFLLATDWRLTLWTPILVQGVIVTSLLSMVLRQFDLRGPWPMLLACVALALFTSLPWVVSQLMADVFTGIVVLALALLGFGSLGRWERTYLVLLAAGAIALHQSHIPLAFGLLVVGCLLRWWQDGVRAALLALRRLAPAPVLGTMLVFSVNLLALGSASLSPFGGVVLAARMIGDKTGTAYLHAACPTEHYVVLLPETDAFGGAIVAERRNHAIVGICVMVLAAMVCNALITGALSGVESRYAARVAWLLAFIRAPS